MKKILILCSLLCLLAAATSVAASSAMSEAERAQEIDNATSNATVSNQPSNSETSSLENSTLPEENDPESSLKRITLFGNSLGVYYIDWEFELNRISIDSENESAENNPDETDSSKILQAIVPVGDNGEAIQVVVGWDIQQALPQINDNTTESPSPQIPVTNNSTTVPSTTQIPTTQVPTTIAPTTQSPTTVTPTTQVPTTAAPTTQTPTTVTPTTQAPVTQAPAATTERPTGSGAIPVTVPAMDYTEDDLLWLARIINAEAGGESMECKIAVGSVVLNRVASSKFPNTIYDVIFQKNQFSPVRSGSIYKTPSEESYEAARRCLAGERTDSRILFFMMTRSASGSWMDRTRELIVIIGTESFYA